MDALDRPPVVRLEAPPQRVGQHLLGQTYARTAAIASSRSARISAGRGEPLAVGQRPARIHRELAVRVAPPADGVVVLQAEAERVHVAVAGRAGRVGAVPSSCSRIDCDSAPADFLEQRHVGRRRRRRHAEDVLQHVLAANHRRRARRIARHGQHAGLAQHAAAPIGRQIARGGTRAR